MGILQGWHRGERAIQRKLGFDRTMTTAYTWIEGEMSEEHRIFHTTRLPFIPPEALEIQARKAAALVPIRVEFETETHRIRDCFVWNLYEDLITPEAFARTFCSDLDLPVNPWAETVANQIRAQIEDHEGVATMDFGLDAMDIYGSGEEEVPECRVVLSVRAYSHTSIRLNILRNLLHA